MIERVLTFESQDHSGNYCDVVIDHNTKTSGIVYHIASGAEVGRENFPGNSFYFVERAAENWARGLKKVDFYNK